MQGLSKIMLVSLTICLCGCRSSGADEAKDYSYNFAYSNLCGRNVNIDNKKWFDYAGTVQMMEARIPIGELYMESLAKGKSNNDLMKIMGGFQEGANKAMSEIQKNGEPDIKQCIKSAKYISKIHKEMNFEKSAQNYEILAKALDK